MLIRLDMVSLKIAIATDFSAPPPQREVNKPRILEIMAFPGLENGA
jgi:hypothetical protein